MAITFDDSATGYVLRLEGDIDVTSSAELKRMLMEAVASRKKVEVDMARATDLDVTAVQLLWAASREAQKTGASFALAGSMPENIRSAVCEAGLENFLAVIPKVAPANPATSPQWTANDRQV